MATFTTTSKNPISWDAPAPVPKQVSTIDFLFSDATDFLFSDGTDYVFSEGVPEITWTQITKNKLNW